MGEPKGPTRSPLTELALLQREIHEIFERLAPVVRAEAPAAGEWLPAVDVYETKGALVVLVEVAGLPPEALRVSFREGRLVVAGERPATRPGSGPGAFLRVERPHGRFRREVPLDVAVDLQQVEARLHAGVLCVTLPRVKDRRRREVVIPVRREREP